MKSSIKLLAALALAAAWPDCAAADGEDPYAGHVKLKKADSTSTSSYFNAGGWDDGRAPHSDTNYYVAAGQRLTYLYTTDGDYAATNLWKGGKLVVAGQFFNSTGWGNSYSPRIPDVEFLGGSEMRIATYGPFWDVDANGTRMNVTITSTRENPVLFSQHYFDSYFSDRVTARNNELRALFHGAEDSAVVFTRPFTNYNGSAIDNGFFFVPTEDEKTFADYNGTVIVRGGNTIFAAYNSGSSAPIGFNFPKSTFRVENGALALMHGRNSAYDTAKYRASATLKGFELVDGTLSYAYASSTPCPVVVATNSFFLGEKGKFLLKIAKENVVGVGPGEAFGKFAKLAHLEGPAAENAVVEDGFGVAYQTTPPIDADEMELKLMDNGDGTKDLYLVGDVVTMTNDNVESTGHPEGSV